MTDLLIGLKIIAMISCVSTLVHGLTKMEFAWVWDVPEDTIAGVAIGTLIYFVSVALAKTGGKT